MSFDSFLWRKERRDLTDMMGIWSKDLEESEAAASRRVVQAIVGDQIRIGRSRIEGEREGRAVEPELIRFWPGKVESASDELALVLREYFRKSVYEEILSLFLSPSEEKLYRAVILSRRKREQSAALVPSETVLFLSCSACVGAVSQIHFLISEREIEGHTVDSSASSFLSSASERESDQDFRRAPFATFH